MPRSTFVGFRCLEQQARRRAGLSIWSNPYRPRVKLQPQTNVNVPRVTSHQETWHLVRGQKNAQFVASGCGLRIKGTEGLRFRTRPSVVQTLHVASSGYHQPTHLLASPFFLGPLIAFLKSSFIVKAGAAVVTFVKTTALAKVFAAGLTYLKSGTVFKTITAVGRISLAIIASLRIQGRRILKWWHGHEYYEKVKAKQKAGSKLKFIPHFRRTTIVFLAAPIVLLAVAILASLERTPVWGRFRVIMMSPDEEALLVEEFLRPGSEPDPHLDMTAARDWLTILRAACGEEAGPPGTLMGMPVVDPCTDWRARWAMDVFTRLEDGVKSLNMTLDHSEEGYNVVKIGNARFAVPPVEYPLTVRPAALRRHGRSEDEQVEGPLITRYGCLVVDSPVCNAFSLGFGPALESDSTKNEEAPGVVVVFTGLLDEILKGNGQHPSEKPENPTSAASSALFGVFQQAAASSSQYSNIPAMPTQRETDQLASTLSHELSHLLLSHSLESWASNDMYELIGVLTTDLIRTLLYPLTAFLGPVFNDWFGEQIRINSALGLRITSSCASRAAEIEADLLGLRILLGAGIDPRIALDEWGVGGLFDRAEQRETGSSANSSSNEKGENANWLERTGFARSHPMNDERHQCIKEELEKWEELGRAVSPSGPGGKKFVEAAQMRRLAVPDEARRATHTTP